MKRISPRQPLKFLSVLLFLPGAAAAQSPLPGKDIPAIAKAANGAIVTIIMAANDKPIAQGTGFLVSADGVIVTNYHVIETGNVAVVKFPDDTAFPVDGVLATDKARDLAVIKIHGKTFRTLALGDSDDIQIGEEVVAIGNPLLLESTVSNGIISGVRTSKEQGGKFLQTTAPISRGSSGGPLFNKRGEVVGINTLYLKVGENLNFAIPVNDAKLLLSHQSAKLQDLPNETEPIKKETEPIKSETTQAETTPSFSKSSLNDTLQWMHNSLRDEGTSPLPEGGTFFAELTDFSGCSVHFTVRGAEKDGEEWRTEYFMNLNYIDPTTVVFDRNSNDQPKTLFGASTTNKRKTVSVKNLTTEEHENVSEIVLFFGHPAYGDQFAEAFRHAVNLCGGKPSALPPPPPSYYVRARKGETYIIEYNGHQLTAHCREALSWQDGKDKLGGPIAENECIYMLGKVGEHISADLMIRQDGELRYRPGGSTDFVADILDITDDVLLGAPKHPHPAPKTSPEILKTLHWIQNTLEDDEGNTVYIGNKNGMLGTRVNLLPDVNGCQVTFTYATRGDESKETFHQRLQVNLGDLDPASLKVDTFTTDDFISVKSDPEVVPGDVISRTMTSVTVHTTDKVPKVRLMPDDRNWRIGMSLPSTELSWELPAPYAARFTKALRQAITQCGGKASTF